MSPDHTTAYIHEIFASIQGEGIYCGQSHTFVRFAGCNLACAYCDTPRSREPEPASCSLPGSGTVPNPLLVQDVLAACERLARKTVALTGGEPLLHVYFLSDLMPALQGKGFHNYLETNGTLYKDLSQVVRYSDCIAMDVKLPSATGQREQWDAHARFLEIASSTEVFVKSVVNASVTDDEIAQCARLIADVDNRTTFVLQPETGNSPSGERLSELQSLAMETLDDVRVIPQCHKVIGVN